MAQDNLTPPAAPALSTWEKIKAGVKGFVKTTIDYLPRGLMFLGLLYGGSALLGSFTGGGGDLLGVANAYNAGDLAGRIGFGLLLGGLISGGIGAYESVREAEASHQAQQSQADGRSQKIEPRRQADLDITPPCHLPREAGKTVTTAIRQ
ncbi:MAG: hypothetical protein KGI29_05660 [Pseudomonadota bacterium]|nr:hypothetical protein [Pseudomonadota bacterium]MDE3038165.1 hypothetical protein [Pseudomonadota bacterium]